MIFKIKYFDYSNVFQTHLHGNYFNEIYQQIQSGVFDEEEGKYYYQDTIISMERIK